MKFSVITIFPGLIRDFSEYSLIGKACQKGLISVDSHDLRGFTKNRHMKVDDRPFGGGPGMVLTPQPLFDAVEEVRNKEDGRVLLFSADGRPLTQGMARELSSDGGHLILVCGRYEGVDQRFIDEMVDEEVSVGPYVLMGGEVAAMVLIETTSRLIPGVIGDSESPASDSHFVKGQMGFPQYTKPRVFRGKMVPEVVLSGHHENIRKWRKEMSEIKKNRYK